MENSAALPLEVACLASRPWF